MNLEKNDFNQNNTIYYDMQYDFKTEYNLNEINLYNMVKLQDQLKKDD